MTPFQIDALEALLLTIFHVLFIPIAWLYAKKRGRRPWVWATVAVFISWIAIVILRLLPDKSTSAATGNPVQPENETAPSH